MIAMGGNDASLRDRHDNRDFKTYDGHVNEDLTLFTVVCLSRLFREIVGESTLSGESTSV